MLINPFEQKGNWYKANLHTHTTTSDGDCTFQTRIRQYQQKGYSVLAITDHNKTNLVDGLSSDTFLLLSGMEIHPPCQLNGECYHFVCLNVPATFTVPNNPDPNACIQEVRKAGGEVIFAHPYWCGQNITHIYPIRDYIGVEVYNATATKIGKAYSSVQWDDMLDLGIEVPAVAVDDCHGGRDIFMGWTMVKAEKLDTASIMNALRTGCYYASCGPEIFDFKVENKTARIRCSPVAEIHFMAQRWHGAGSFFADAGPDLTTAEVTLPEDPNVLKYLRAEIIDRKGNHAWTNPVFLKK